MSVTDVCLLFALSFKSLLWNSLVSFLHWWLWVIVDLVCAYVMCSSPFKFNSSGHLPFQHTQPFQAWWQVQPHSWLAIPSSSDHMGQEGKWTECSPVRHCEGERDPTHITLLPEYCQRLPFYYCCFWSLTVPGSHIKFHHRDRWIEQTV
jgi:hypothetical protein